MAARSAKENLVDLLLTVRVRLVDKGAAGLGVAIADVPDFAAMGAAAWASEDDGWMVNTAAAMAKRVMEQKEAICGYLMDFSVSRQRRILKLRRS